MAPKAGSSAPGLKSAPHKSLLDFDFVADERTVSITLDHSPQALEGCTVNTTLHDFYDMHTNIGNPVTWSFVVRQNPLTWNTTEVTTKVSASNGGTFTATLTNNSSTTQDWSFVGLPSWLTANMTSGSILANQSQDIQFTIPSGTAIGKYFATVSVRAGIGIDTPLDISVSVEGQRPDWTEASGYDESMTVIAQIKIDGIVSTDPDDMLGAFTDPGDGGLGDCLGVAQPKYTESRDAYYVQLMVYGNNSIVGENVRFRIYDASTGLTYPLTNVSEPVVFTIDGSAGEYDNPVIVENTDKVLQTLELKQGTNWASFYLAPDKNQVSTLFQPVAGKISTIAFADGQTVSYNGTAWSADHPVGVGQMMKINMNGQETFKFAVKSICKDIADVAADAGVRMEDISWVVPHQANSRIIDFAKKKLPIPGDRFYLNIERYGNTSSASIPIALDELNRKGCFRRGELLALCAFGGGLSSAACIIRW